MRSVFFLALWKLVLLYAAEAAVMNFGGGPCAGQASFETEVKYARALTVAAIPVGVLNLKVTVEGDRNVDLRISSGTVDVTKRFTGVFSSGTQQTATWQGDSITYSGYRGGNETFTVSGRTKNPYLITVVAYSLIRKSNTTISYSWTDRQACTPAGKASLAFSSTSTGVSIGTIPAGMTDVFVRVDTTSGADVDIQVFDGDVQVIGRGAGLFSAAIPNSFFYKGSRLEYSGYTGEQNAGTEGDEYIRIAGYNPSELKLMLQSSSAGTGTVTYEWGYYSAALGLSGSDLFNALHDIIKVHQKFSYTNVYTLLERIDQDPNNTANVLGIYSGRSMTKVSRPSWNREHVWSQAHGNLGTTIGPGTDLHEVHAIDGVINNIKSSKWFVAGGTAVPACPGCFTNDGRDTFEPGDIYKGETARVIFYMGTRYTGDAESSGHTMNVVDGTGYYGSDFNGRYGDKATLKVWNNKFYPRATEVNRNNIVYLVQGNRNPFVDYPEWVDLIY